MTNPLTHLIWGFVIGRAFDPAPRYIIMGMLTGILLDADQVIPGLAHHGFFHTPVFPP
jgi:hypothetical protein